MRRKKLQHSSFGASIWCRKNHALKSRQSREVCIISPVLGTWTQSLHPRSLLAGGQDFQVTNSSADNVGSKCARGLRLAEQAREEPDMRRI